MKRKNRAKKGHRPVRYLKYKGRFGSKGFVSKVELNYIEIPKCVSLSPDGNASELIKRLDTSLREPQRVIDFRKVDRITIRGGLVLRAYRDEFFSCHGSYPKIRAPKDKKMKTVLQFLGYEDYGMNHLKYDDIDCWDIRSWDASDDFSETDIPRLIMEEVIPKCYKKGETFEGISADLASAIAEAINNSSEHAYEGRKKDNKFRKWYLSCGIYPNSKKIMFCVYDKGQGFKDSMTQNAMWGISNPFEADYKYIEKAAQGTSGTREEGRGQGLKTAVAKLNKVNGTVEILSGKGLYSTDPTNHTRDRRTFIDGSVIAFFVPVK